MAESICERCGLIVPEEEIQMCDLCGMDGLGNCCIGIDDHDCGSDDNIDSLSISVDEGDDE